MVGNPLCVDGAKHLKVLVTVKPETLFALSVSEMQHSSLKGLWPGPTGSSLRCVGLSSLILPLEEVRTREDTERFCESLLGGRRERTQMPTHHSSYLRAPGAGAW